MVLSIHSEIGVDFNSLVIFDRDNTLCEDFGAMSGESDCVILPGVIEGIKMLGKVAPIIAIATNQSYVGRGLLTLNQVEDFHRKLVDSFRSNGVNIHLIAICPHTPSDDCFCRKPKPGMLNELIEFSKIKDRNRVFFVGDKDSDERAAISAGVHGLRVDSSNFESICKFIGRRLIQ
jgi:D-glycero-D-manno-heptose 1,7-bisphosphate phosphatase